MIIDILGDKTTTAYIAARGLIVQHGHTPASGRLFSIDLAIAPLLTKKYRTASCNRPA